MKKLIKHGYLYLLFCLATALTVAACSTTGMQRSEDVQSSMEAVDNDIKQIVVQLDAIGASLEELTKPGQADLKKAFDLFSKNVSQIEDMEEQFKKDAARMEASGEAYFSKWDSDKQNYDNAEIQRRSDERREALGETYDKIAENNVGVKEAFETYVSDINEIERFLSNDLTTDGLDAISPVSDNVLSNGKHLKSELKQLQNAIEDARSEMSRS